MSYLLSVTHGSSLAIFLPHPSSGEKSRRIENLKQKEGGCNLPDKGKNDDTLALKRKKERKREHRFHILVTRFLLLTTRTPKHHRRRRRRRRLRPPPQYHHHH